MAEVKFGSFGKTLKFTFTFKYSYLNIKNTLPYAFSSSF